jgi:hypothetical protein
MIPVILETGVETTVSAIRAEHPGLMFGQGSDLSHVGIGWLVETPRPDGYYQRGPNELVDGQWRMTWVEYTPEPEVVTQVTQRQARLALLGAGLLSGVEAALDAMPEPQRTAAKIEWEYALFIDRNGQLTLSLAAALGLTEQQMDALFTQAATL